MKQRFPTHVLQKQRIDETQLSAETEGDALGRVTAWGACCPHFGAQLNLTRRGAVAAGSAVPRSRDCRGEFFQRNGEADMAQSVLGTFAWFREEETRKTFPKERVVS